MPKELKHAMAEELRVELEAAQNLLVVAFRPMDAGANLALRRTLRDHGARLRVIHNRATRFALDEARKPLGDLFGGQTALALVPGDDPDLVSIAKTLMEAQRRKRLEVRGGFVDGEILDMAGVDLLARSPDKPTLRGMLCAAIVGSARGVAVALNAVPAGLARCLQERIDKTQEQEDES